MKWASQKAHRRYRSPTEALDPREIGLQNSLDFREIGLKNSLDFRKIGLTFWYFLGLKEVLQSSVIFASARFTEICRGLGRYAPNTPPHSRDFRKVSAYFCELSGGYKWG